MNKEIWKSIEGFEGYYEVSNFGRVKSLSRIIKCRNGSFRNVKERMLKLSPHKNNGYINVWLSIDSHKKMFIVHRLVAKYFVNNPHNNNIVNHINEVRDENEFHNLEWVTHAENLAYRGAFQRGRLKVRKQIFQYSLDGILLKIYDYAQNTHVDGFRPNGVTQACLGYVNTYYGFIWSYQEL
jgi:hypothetical protein